MLVPDMGSERTQFLEDIAHQVIPSFDFYAYSLACAAALVVAILVDAPALYIPVILLAPFMAPFIGLSIATIVGSGRFFLQTLGGMGIGSLVIFTGGMLAGWISSAFPARAYQQALQHAHFSFADVVVLTIGAGLSTYLLVRNPRQQPRLASVALAYELFLPLGVAGFGLTSGVQNLFPNGLVVYLIHLAWGILAGTLVLAVIGLRPLTMFGYALGTSILIVCLAALITAGGIGAITMYQMPTPTLTLTLTVTPTATRYITSTPLPPTHTATRTLTQTLSPTFTNTPVPPTATPFLAVVSAKEGNGAWMRTEPDQQAPTVKVVLNGTLLEVTEIIERDGRLWARVRLPADGSTGWMLQYLISTTTPTPGR